MYIRRRAPSLFLFLSLSLSRSSRWTDTSRARVQMVYPRVPFHVKKRFVSNSIIYRTRREIVARGKIVVSEIKRKPSHTTTRTRGEIVLGFFAKVRLISFFAGLRVCGPLKKRKKECATTRTQQKKQRPVVTTLFFLKQKKKCDVPVPLGPPAATRAAEDEARRRQKISSSSFSRWLVSDV